MQAQPKKAPLTANPPGSTQFKLKKSFKRAVLPLLNSISKEDLRTAFPSCTDEEQQRLHQLFLKVITSLHGNIEDTFGSLCDEMKVGEALDSIDRLIEEQSLDPLKADETNVLDTVRTLSMARNSEVRLLTRSLEKAEENYKQLQMRIELLKKRQQDLLVAASSIEKMSGAAASYKMPEPSNW